MSATGHEQPSQGRDPKVRILTLSGFFRPLTIESRNWNRGAIRGRPGRPGLPRKHYGLAIQLGVTSAARLSRSSLTPMIETVLSGTRLPGEKEIDPVMPL